MLTVVLRLNVTAGPVGPEAGGGVDGSGGSSPSLAVIVSKPETATVANVPTEPSG